MKPVMPWLAQDTTIPLEDALKETGVDYRFTIVLTALLMVTLGLFLWAAFVRRRKHRRRYHYRRHSADPLTHKTEHGSSFGRLFSRKHHRRRHRQRPLNPTLAEAGGLPPARPEEPPPTST